MTPLAIDMAEQPVAALDHEPDDSKAIVPRFDFTAIDGDFARLLSTTTGRSFLDSTDFASAREYRVHCWHEAHRVFADYRKEPATANGRKCRLPRSQVEMAARAGMSFDQVRASLDISAAHLKAVQERLKIRLRFRPHPDLDNLDFDLPLPGRDVVTRKLAALDMPAAAGTINIVETDEGTIQLAKDSSKRNKPRRHRFHGNDLAQWIKEIYDDFVAMHDRPPTKSYFKAEYGITHASVVKYWPGPTIPVIDVALDANVDVDAELTTEAEVPPTALSSIKPVPTDDLELIASAAEHAFGNALVDGAYTDASGKYRCDELVEVEGEFRPMIRQWRQHIDVTRTILAFAARQTT